MELGAQHALRFAAADREIAMRRDRRERLLEARVGVELRRLVAVLLLLRDADDAVAKHGLAQALAHLGVLGDPLGADVARAGEGRLTSGLVVGVDEARAAAGLSSGCDHISSASGSSPRSRAMVARVRRLGLNGR